MSLAGFAELFKNPHTASLVSSIDAFMSNEKSGMAVQEAARNMSGAVMQVTQSLCASAEGHAAEPFQEIIQDAEPCIPMLTPQLSELPENNWSFAAAVSNPKLVTHGLATMPALKFGFLSPHNREILYPNSRVGSLDGGCSVNLISRSTLERDFHLFGPKAEVHQVKPFSVELADGKSVTATTTCVTGAQIVIGHAVYEVDFFVMDNLAREYLLGWPWQYEYDVVTMPQKSQISIVIDSPNSYLRKDRPFKDTQWVPIHFRTRLLTLAVRD